jgi:Domain of unknown function (DUF5655)
MMDEEMKIFFAKMPQAIPIYNFLAERLATSYPDVYIIVSFGLSHRIISPRIVEAVEPYSNRWTHHVILQNPEEVDDEFMNWMQEAYELAGRE